MNPQYMQQQQQTPQYGPPPSNAPYGEPNANVSLTQPFGPPPMNNPSNSFSPPYYVNDVRRQPTDTQRASPMSPSNQNNIIDQMSSMNLSGHRSPSQDFSTLSGKNTPTINSPSTTNGINQNHHVQGDLSINNMSVNKSALPQKLLPQQLPPVSNASNQLPPRVNAAGPAFSLPTSGHSPSYGNIPDNTVANQIQRSPQMNPPPQSNPYYQVPSFDKYGATQSNQANLAGPPLAGKPPDMSQRSPSVNQSLVNQIPSNLPQGSPSNRPLTSPTSSNPLSPMSNRQFMATQTSQVTSPTMSQQHFSRPPLASQNSMSGSPVSGQQLSSPYGQQMPSGPMPVSGQQPVHSPQNVYNSQPDQRRYTQNAYQPGQMNYQNNDYYQGHPQQQPQYAPNQNMYANQASPYQTGMSSPTGNYAPSAQAQRRLDPEQMPSPIQVIQEDQRTKGGVFATNQKGLVPPLVTTKFIVEDQGNASPRFIRSSVYNVPATADMVKQTQIPFSLILSPMAQIEEGEFEPPIVDMGELGPVRCNRCKAYMSPFMQFIDAGRRFQCLLCRATTEVPAEYFAHLDHTGQRMDRFERPELMLGTYEFIATKDYCRNNTFPKPPAIVFIIDVSYNTVKSGLVNLLCSEMKKIIQNLPVDVGQTKSNVKVGFITYNNTVQFYNLSPNLAQPQMMIVGDVHEVFMPLLDGFLCDPIESETLIDNLMTQIPLMFGGTRETETILAPAIQAGLEALKASDTTGKLMVFHSSLPIADAPGKLKNRDDRKLLGTDNEKSVLAPQTTFYNNLGQDCVGSGCSVDLFVFNNSYIDVATIGQVCRLTGGDLYKYTYFQADDDGERLITDIINNISRPVAFDAVMRVRTSTGIRPTEFYGHLYMSNTTDIELASIDCDKAIAVEIKHDDKIAEDDTVCIQAALLYTSCSGVRRLRIINLSLKATNQMGEIFRACDLDAIINFLSKQTVFKLVDSTPKVVKEALNARCAAILASYRKQCASPSSSGQLILPECMKVLPVYINGLLKSDALAGAAGGITIDQKSYVMMAIATMPISESLVHVYPRLFAIHEVSPQDNELPPMLRCSMDKYTDDGAYLLENGIYMFLWLGGNLSPQWLKLVFGVSSVTQVNTDKSYIPVLDNDLNRKIRDIVAYIGSERRYCMKLAITRQRDKMEQVMRQFLVEDRGADGSPSYVDFLCQLHREIRTLLS
ncbi:hypothetical protein TKK_0014270 [Trichogramma kaykai]|uniref:Protein transport protein Sec24C n=1 Tax=Trichogramma kaykai TaxID=54128 RepID=A0ABD2WE07_9HYME